MEIHAGKRNWLKASHDKSTSVAELASMALDKLFMPKIKTREWMRVTENWPKISI